MAKVVRRKSIARAVALLSFRRITLVAPESPCLQAFNTMGQRSRGCKMGEVNDPRRWWSTPIATQGNAWLEIDPLSIVTFLWALEEENIRSLFRVLQHTGDIWVHSSRSFCKTLRVVIVSLPPSLITSFTSLNSVFGVEIFSVG